MLYACRVKWDVYPKRFPIPSGFQDCNIKEYSQRRAENHKKEQIDSVTQHPSEYLIKTKKYVLSMVDCPGAADTRSVEVDVENSINIADFIAKVGNFNAICIVLKNSTNRGTSEARYFVEQIKTIIPKSAYNRIFILVSYASSASKNVQTFAKQMGLPKYFAKCSFKPLRSNRDETVFKLFTNLEGCTLGVRVSNR